MWVETFMKAHGQNQVLQKLTLANGGVKTSSGYKPSRTSKIFENFAVICSRNDSFTFGMRPSPEINQ